MFPSRARSKLGQKGWEIVWKLPVGTYSDGNLFVVYDMSRHVLPTAPSPTTTHLIVCIFSLNNYGFYLFCSSFSLNLYYPEFILFSMKQNEASSFCFKMSGGGIDSLQFQPIRRQILTEPIKRLNFKSNRNKEMTDFLSERKN